MPPTSTTSIVATNPSPMSTSGGNEATRRSAVFDFRYTPDGRLLLLTTAVDVPPARNGEIPCRCESASVGGRSRRGFGDFSVSFLDANSCVGLRIIDFSATACAAHRCANLFRSSISRCGRYVALRVASTGENDISAGSSRRNRRSRRQRRSHSRRDGGEDAGSSENEDNGDDGGELGIPTSRNDPGKILVYRLPVVTMPSLHDACRRAVLSAMARSHAHRGHVIQEVAEGKRAQEVGRLQLPRALVGYLKFAPHDS